MDIVFSSTTELADAIRRGQISASDVLEAHLTQIEKLNSSLNAIVTLDIEGARKRAKEADDALARGELWGPLHGVPFTLKDAHATAGMRTTTGFAVFDHVPGEDSTVTARLKAAGGVIMGKTNVAELLGDALQSTNTVFGRTNNPWNVERTPGGSSGGAAAAVAAGLTPFDVGSDLAGSIRLPAHFCGVFGLKPTENRVSLAGFVPDPFNTPRSLRIMSCLGPIARTAEDLALLYTLIAGPDGRDTDVHPVPVEGLIGCDLKGLRVAFAPTIADLPVAADIREALSALAGQLADLGAIVEEAPLPSLDFAQDGARLGELIGIAIGAFQPGAQPATLTQYMQALHFRDQSILAWESFFESWDVLLCPASMTTAFPHCEPGSMLHVDGRETPYWLGNAHSATFNYSGHPAVVMPYKQDADGLPIGVQLVAKRWDESRLLGITQAVARLTNGFQRPPRA